MILAVDNYDYAIFWTLRVAYSETSIYTVYHNEKVLKASDQRDIVWSVSSACYLDTGQSASGV